MATNLLVDITSTASGSSSGSWANVPGLSATSITVQSTGSLLLLITTVTLNDSSTDSTAAFRFYVNGAAITNGPEIQCFEDNTNGERGGMSMAYALTGLSGSTNSFSVQWITQTGSPAIETDLNHSFQVIEVEDSASILVNSFATSSSTSPSTEGNLFQSTSISVAATGSVLLMLANVPCGGTSDGSAAFRFGVDDSAEGARGTMLMDTTNEISGWSGMHAKTGISGSHSFELKWQTAAGTAVPVDTTRTRTFQVVEFTDGCEILDSVITTTTSTVTTAWANDSQLTTTQDVTTGALQLIFANACQQPSGTDGCLDISIGIGSTNYGGGLSLYNDSTSVFQGGFVAFAETGLTGSNTFQMRHREVQNGVLNTTYNRSLFVLEFTETVSRDQEGYRWRDDDGSESTASWHESQDTSHQMDYGSTDNIRLRVLTDYTGDPPAEAITLEYKEVGDADTEWRSIPTFLNSFRSDPGVISLVGIAADVVIT